MGKLDASPFNSPNLYQPDWENIKLWKFRLFDNQQFLVYVLNSLTAAGVAGAEGRIEFSPRRKRLNGQISLNFPTGIQNIYTAFF